MKIVFTGGGSGGHFYPLTAIAEAVNDQIKEQKILDAKLYYIADKPYDEKALFVNNLEFVEVPTGKIRLYFSIQNFFDLFKTFGALFRALSQMIKIYPDVVISKGGYPAFPVVIAAKFLNIPVIMHESDMAAGRVNKITSRFAEKIAVSFPDAIEAFPASRNVAWTGQPIRKELWEPAKEGAYEYLNLEQGVPIIVIYGGSQGSKIINDAIFEVLPGLTQRYQIIHQVGVNNIADARKRSNFILQDSEFKDRYHPYGFLNALSLKMLGGAASLFITRGGAGSIFDISMWGIPGIIIPITNSNGDHQRKNAYAYASTGAAIVIEEKNLEPHLLLQEIDRLFEEEGLLKSMQNAGEQFIRKDAGEVIAKEAIQIALSHEQ